MQQQIRFATFNVCNLAPAGAQLYDNLQPLTAEEYEAKAEWTAWQLDRLDADVVGFQEIFSQAALRDVLSRTRKYRDAYHAGFDPDPLATRLTPNVALVSRLPLAGPPIVYTEFPHGVGADSGNPDSDRFARAPLHAQVVLPNETTVDVVVVHLKSRRPDYRGGECGADCGGDALNHALNYAMANLRSLVWRGTEAVALRVLLSKLMRENRRPCIVMGDFNDTADAVTTTIVMGAGAPLPAKACGGAPDGEGGGLERRGRMFDCAQIQQRQDQLRHVGYTTVHEGQYSTIDHVLVSEEFHPDSPRAFAEVVDVTYLNDHLGDCKPEVSDHGQVRVRLRLKA
ncbi:endonuclease/exonuclease/phosphatase family protein [Pseudoduganella namucuonensis]|uniref:Endonuclease/Exonuclease/phosphatase family protein n=1 Tax=Pseudoduganella namucuonensis TaxID=1035707 RepID=A0A1I7FVE0_9BURK|nr:endonuclease/exonuclease/phosphatase family protein [Pseudoduganella namucuonensis]SFU40006.1 Endonuclease/Exonuclease/phosphatase family protein [Pseudoduganella namucuonensis]